MVEKLPFAGDLGRTPGPREAFPIRSILHLRQGANAVRPLSGAFALALLIASAPFVNGDPHRISALEENLESLLRTVPVGELTFSLQGGFWDLLAADRSPLSA